MIQNYLDINLRINSFQNKDNNPLKLKIKTRAHFNILTKCLPPLNTIRILIISLISTFAK